MRITRPTATDAATGGGSAGRSGGLHRGRIAEVSKQANGGAVSMVLSCFADRGPLHV